MTDDPTIQVTASLTPQGYRGVLLHLSALRLRLIVPLMAFFGFASLGAGFNTQAYLMLAALVAVVLTVWGYIAWNVSSPSRLELYLPVAYEFGPDGIIYASGSDAGTIEWRKISRWRSVPGHFVLYVTGATYLLVPERDFAQGDNDRFETLLRGHVRKGPKRRI